MRIKYKAVIILVIVVNIICFDMCMNYILKIMVFEKTTAVYIFKDLQTDYTTDLRSFLYFACR